jgi:ribose-phosphate pyrophosphokinase
MFDRLKVFSGSSNPDLVDEICQYLDIEPGKRSIVKFSNENIKVKIEENVRGCDVFVVQTSAPPVNESFMELLILIDAIKYASADRITAVLPFYPYARSDKKDEPRISVTARLVADLLATTGADRILTMNLHSPQVVGFARIPADQLLANPLLCDYFAQKMDLTNFIVVASDVGRAKEAEYYSQRLNLPMAILDKRRHDDSEAPVIHNIIGEVEGRDVIIFDDEVSTGGTLIVGLEALKKAGAGRIFVGCTHGAFTKDAVGRIEASCLDELVVTNTIPFPKDTKSSKITILNVGRAFGQAIRAIHNGDSVSKLFG